MDGRWVLWVDPLICYLVCIFLPSVRTVYFFIRCARLYESLRVRRSCGLAGFAPSLQIVLHASSPSSFHQYPLDIGHQTSKITAAGLLFHVPA